uniref:Uncharacterized protein n=1 Tax=Arundo donax TaxID=35708 RepID=A0A0A8YJD0_ARUDO
MMARAVFFGALYSSYNWSRGKIQQAWRCKCNGELNQLIYTIV